MFPLRSYLCDSMRIVVDTLSENSNNNNRDGLTLNEIYFLDKSFQLLMTRYPEHEWITDAFDVTKGAISLLPLGIKKRMVLEKLKPDVFVTAIGANKSSPFKQIIFLRENFDLNKIDTSRIPSASVIITTSTQLKNQIHNATKSASLNVKVVPAASAEDVSLADWSEKLTVKEKYSDGREFFLCFKSISRSSQWEEILKAFSIFKKWQQSSFKLLLVGQVGADFRDELEGKLASYKYRTDVSLLDPAIEDIHRILPSAFGLICADKDYTGINMLNAFQAEVPVISSPNDLFDEEVSGAFLPAIPMADELSRQLINLYRDERLRDTLIEKGREVVKRYSWDDTVTKWAKVLF